MLALSQMGFTNGMEGSDDTFAVFMFLKPIKRRPSKFQRLFRKTL